MKKLLTIAFIAAMTTTGANAGQHSDGDARLDKLIERSNKLDAEIRDVVEGSISSKKPAELSLECTINFLQLTMAHQMDLKDAYKAMTLECRKDIRREMEERIARSSEIKNATRKIQQLSAQKNRTDLMIMRRLDALDGEGN
ncbi:MAG: hypothetical protein ACPGXY_04725 [Alphaproteobacteria bacterium]